MASGGANKVVRIWDVATATPTSTLHVSRLMPACVQTHACITLSVNKRLAWPEQGKVGCLGQFSAKAGNFFAWIHPTSYVDVM